VGLAQYTLRQYDEAEGSFEAVRAADPYRLQCMDTFSNILYVKVRGTGLLGAGCLVLSVLARGCHTLLSVDLFLVSDVWCYDVMV
jgi:hypothetical protein